MNWLILVILAILFDSSRIYADNYLSDVYFKGNGAASQKLFYIFFHIIIGTILLIIFGLDFSLAEPYVFVLFIVAGFLSSIAGIFYYKVLEIDDSTNLGIFYQLSPVLYLILGAIFLGDEITPFQFIAFVFILAAPILIIITTAKRSRKTKSRAVIFAFIYVFISVVGNLIFVKENTSALSFPTEMALLFFGKALGNTAIMFINRKWIKRFKYVFKTSHGKVLRPLLLSGSLNTVKDFAYRGALSFAPSVALASAVSDSSEPIVIFFMGIILTLIAPKFGREKLTKKSVIVHLIATILVVIGIVLIQK